LPQNTFSAPSINRLEIGKYYVQIAAYSNAEAVNPEISRIDNRLPIAVMDVGTPEAPLYRVLIGPLTLGEAGAIVQRFRSTHRDAFVRVGE
jgi:cell division septation protein DedD